MGWQGLTILGRATLMHRCDRFLFQKGQGDTTLCRMKVGIVGASGAGLYAALLLSYAHPDYEIHLFDQNRIIGKKLLATGNGHCNLLPSKLDRNMFSNPDEFDRLSHGISLEDLKGKLESLGVSLEQVNNLYYPASYHAPTHVRFLEKSLENKGVIFHLDTKILDYQKQGKSWILSSEKGDFCMDFVIFAPGGLSQSKLGSDGSLVQTFKNHGYAISPLHPGLAPIQTKESVKALSGIRHASNCALIVNGKKIAEEPGEVLFKKDGLSGICIFNLESVFVRHYLNEKCEIHLNLFPTMSEEELTLLLEKNRNLFGEDYLYPLLVKPLQEYVIFGAKRLYGNDNCGSIARILKDLTFHICGHYPFEESQVTVGGIQLQQVDDHFQSKLEQGIFIIGECLDMDGLCGGNNLAWCLIGALKVCEAI